MAVKRAISLSAAQRAYAVNRTGEHEVIWSPLYDTQAYAAAGQTILSFFQVQQGQSSKTLADTNMEAAGSLPAPKHFLCTGIEVTFHPGNTPGSVGDRAVAATAPGRNWGDLFAFYKSGLLRFFIGSKDYLVDAPVGVFPPGYRLSGGAAITDQTTAAAASLSQIDYAAVTGKPYDITPVFIPSQQNFRVTLEWPTAVALPSGVAGRVGVRLMGYLYRLSQ